MKRLLLIINIIIISLSVFAQGEEITSEFEKKLNEASSKNLTIVARFLLEKSIVNIKKPLIKEGDFYYDNTGNIAMYYDEPVGDKIIISNEDFIIVNDGKAIEQSASSNPLMKQISYMMQASMSGDVAKLGRGWERKLEKIEGQYKISLYPSEKRIKRYITSITLVFDEQNMTLNSMRIDESKGSYTAYYFNSKQINADIKPEIFTK